MSSRQLRKLRQQRDLEQSKLREQKLAAEDPEEDEDDEVPVPVIKQSLFANFAALQDPDEDSDEGEEDPIEANEETLTSTKTQSEEPMSIKGTKPPKKKKKKAKAKVFKDENPTSDENMDEIDKILKELKIKATKNEGSPRSVPDVSPSTLDIPHRKTHFLLRVDTHHLKVGNEMRNLFGRAALENHNDAGGHIPGGARRRQHEQRVDLETALKGRHLPGRGFPEVTLRRNIFIQGKDDWPRGTTGGLSMENLLQAHSNGAAEFTFVHDSSYRTVQQQFNAMVEEGEPMNLIVLLQSNPYHISLLLQVSKIAKDQGDHALSSDLVERALFSFARATTPLFASSLSQGLARLQFARRENREFWLAGYHYIKSLVMKGTYRTALEWAKLLLIVDASQSDPYCMLLVIHHLALRAHEFQWLLDLSESSVWKNTAIHEIDAIAYASHITPSLAFAALQLKDAVKCRSLLRHSMRYLPWLFCRLFQELGLDKPPPSIWGARPRTDAENLFTEVYILQTKDLWNTPEATALLVEVAETTEKLNDKKIPKTENSAITLDVARFVYLDNTPALMALVPSSLMHRPDNSDPDPLPPDNDIDAPEGLNRYYDPIFQMRRLFPGWVGNGGVEDQAAIEAVGRANAAEGTDWRDDVDDGFETDNYDTGREGDSDEHGEEEDGDAEVGDREVTGQSNAVGRLYNYLFGRRGETSSTEIHGQEHTSEDAGTY